MLVKYNNRPLTRQYYSMMIIGPIVGWMVCVSPMVLKVSHHLHKHLGLQVNILILVVGHLFDVGNDAPLLHYPENPRLISH